MFKNYLAAALRNLARNRLYAAINIVGLAVAFAAAILIGLFVRNELSFDRWIPGADTTYLAVSGLTLPGKAEVRYGTTSPDVAGWLTLNAPSVEAVARVAQGWIHIDHGQNTHYGAEHIVFADPSFFSVLRTPALYGDLDTALAAPDRVVITRAMARKYFGRDDPVGDSLTLSPLSGEGPQVMRVSAVLRDLPAETHLNAEVYVSSQAHFGPFVQINAFAATACPICFTFSPIAVRTYLRLKPGASVTALTRRIESSFQAEMSAVRGLDEGGKLTLTFAPVSSLHHRPDLQMMELPAVDPALLYAVSGFGVLLLVIASINFVNLMTARASRRAVEVGVRKVAGAGRGQLIVQFIGESLLYVILAMVIAMALAEQLLAPLNAFLDRAITFDWGHDLGLAGGLLGLVVVVGVLAGAYPALVLSAFRPAAVLKGGLVRAGGSARVRQVLVVFQFALLIGLVITTGLVFLQTQFALVKGAHLDLDQVVIAWNCQPGFKDEVAALADVKAVTCSDYGALSGKDTPLLLAKRPGAAASVNMQTVGFGFFELFQIHPLAGRTFSKAYGADAAQMSQVQPTFRFTLPHVVINAAAARQLGFASPSAAIGQQIYLANSGNVASDQPSQIIGVVPDFALESVLRPVPPTLYDVMPFDGPLMSIKLTGGRIPATLKTINRLALKFDQRPLAVQFLSDAQRVLFHDMIRLSTLMAMVAGVAVFVAALGLFGLAAFTAEQRTKEIGIRKAMGAERWDIVRLLVWRFTQPVLWANLIAWPAALWLMIRWLSGFAYRIDPPLWLFPAAGALALLIAWLTIAAQAYAVASAKPVKALRYE